MGHHPQQVALQGHLLHQTPTVAGIGLQPERTRKHAPLPAQALGGRKQHRAREAAPGASGAALEHPPLAHLLLHPTGLKAPRR